MLEDMIPRITVYFVEFVMKIDSWMTARLNDRGKLLS